jgi:hypothetical protein
MAEVIDRQGDVRYRRFPNRLAVFNRLRDCQHVELSLHAVGDLVEDNGALGRRCLPPFLTRLTSRIEG